MSYQATIRSQQSFAYVEHPDQFVKTHPKLEVLVHELLDDGSLLEPDALVVGDTIDVTRSGGTATHKVTVTAVPAEPEDGHWRIEVRRAEYPETIRLLIPSVE